MNQQVLRIFCMFVAPLNATASDEINLLPAVQVSWSHAEDWAYKLERPPSVKDVQDLYASFEVSPA